MARREGEMEIVRFSLQDIGVYLLQTDRSSGAKVAV
ncbi:MAG: hypothetical protein ACI93R_002777 [Flavobacteriales bacterium]|jgi:hypothetical protein